MASRPPDRRSRPSARAAAAAYMRAQGPSPVACTLCHLYGLTAVSSAQASARGCEGRAREGCSLCALRTQTRLVAVVAAEDEEEALTHERQDVRVASARPLALHDLHRRRVGQ